jgi:hypothetical protein
MRTHKTMTKPSTVAPDKAAQARAGIVSYPDMASAYSTGRKRNALRMSSHYRGGAQPMQSFSSVLVGYVRAGD